MLMLIFTSIRLFLRALFTNQSALAAENLALRQQLTIYHRSVKRPQLQPRDRFFWVVLSHLWQRWREVLIIVQPETVIRWHRQGFALYWRWRSKVQRPGRPQIDREIRDLIRRMSAENPLWGTPRIHAELQLLGYTVAESTVDKYRVRNSKPPSQSWRGFLANHIGQIAAIDFFVVPTATFRLLFCFVVLLHERRRVIHFNVTSHPTSEWTAQQIVEAFPLDELPNTSCVIVTRPMASISVSESLEWRLKKSLPHCIRRGRTHMSSV